MSSDIPVTQPAWLDDVLGKILANQNKNQQKTDVAISEVQVNLTQINGGLGVLKTEVSGIVTRMNAIEERADDTAKRVDDLDDKFHEFKRDLLDQFEFLTQQTKLQGSKQPAAGASDVQISPVVLISEKPSDRVPISHHDPLSDLMEEAEAKCHHFFFGLVKEGNKPVIPILSSAEVIRRFFATVSLSNNGPTDGTYRRVIVDSQHYSRFKAKIRENSADMKALGWWAAPERPQRLKAMIKNALAFFAILKENHPQLRQHFWDIDGGYLSCDGSELAPVIFIRLSRKIWPRITNVIILILAENSERPWAEQFDRLVVSPKKRTEWEQLAGLLPPYDPQIEPDQDMSGSDGEEEAPLGPRNVQETEIAGGFE